MAYSPIPMYSKTCVKRPLSKRQRIGFQDLFSLNAGQKYYRMLQWEHSAILLTCIKRYHFCVLFEWPFKIGSTVHNLFTS